MFEFAWYALVSHFHLSSHPHFSVVPESRLSFSQCSVVAVCASAVTRFVSISELLFPVLSLATPPLLSSSLAFSLSPLTFLAVVSACAAVISVFAVFPVFSGSAAISVVAVAVFSASVDLLLSAAVSLLLLLSLLCCCVSGCNMCCCVLCWSCIFCVHFCGAAAVSARVFVAATVSAVAAAAHPLAAAAVSLGACLCTAAAHSLAAAALFVGVLCGAMFSVVVRRRNFR